MLCQCKSTTEQYYLDAKHSQQHNGAQNSATQCNMTLGWRGQQPILFHPTTQSTVSTNRTAWVKTSTVMLLQKHTMPCLPSWLSVLPMLCMDLCSCLSERSSPSHDGTVVAQRAGWDRPVKEERQTLMNGPQQEELSSGLQQQDAIWPRSRQLPEINAIPSVPPSLFNNNSLSSSLWGNV